MQGLTLKGGRLRLSYGGKLGMGVVASLLWTSLAVAQLTTGNIAGTVTDQSGAAVPGVAITVTNVETGATRSSVTGTSGRYEFPNLSASSYEVTAALAGFQTSIRRGIGLTVGRTAVVDHTLQIGEITQQVTVTGEVSLVETSSATVSQLVDERKVEDLPLNNRDLTGLSFLQPGVLKVPTNGQQGVFSGMGDKVSVAGARQTQNAYLLDGVSNADFSGNAQGASGAYLGADTIKEYQIITNNYSAEYRSQAGAIISAITKSGTNSLHGTAFEYLRNDNLDAANFFDNRDGDGVKPEFKRNQFGGSLGGPVIQDKTFFFGSYEGLRERLNTTNQARVLGADARVGILPDRTVTVNPIVQPYINLFPVPGVGNSVVQTFDDGSVQIAGNKKQPTRSDFVAGKMDQQFANQALGFWSATYNYDDSVRSPFGILGDVTENGDSGGNGLTSKKHTFSSRLTGVFSPTTLNEINVGYSWSEIAGDLPLTDRDFSDIAFLPGKTRVGQVNVGELNAVGFRVDGSLYNQKVLTFKEGLSLSRGNHSFRLGAELTRYKYGQASCSRGCNGIYDFRDIRRFLIADPRRFQGFVPGSESPPYNFTQWLVGTYFQDNWQVASSLTFNLGIRYEATTVPSEENDQIASFVDFTNDTSLRAPASVQSRYPDFPFAGTIDQFYKNPSLKSFSPRFGFAWAPGDRKTSLRGGFGIFYDHIALFNIRTTIQELPPYAQVARIDDSDDRNLAFPNAVTENADQLTGGRFNIRTFDFEPKNTYIYRYSLNLQREIGTEWVVSAGYTGSRGLHLWQQGLPNINRWDGWPENPPPGTAKHFTEEAGLIKPGLGEIRIQSSNANSWYNGLALSAQKRMTRGLQAQFSYNVANSIDQGSGVTSGGEELPNGQRGIYFWDMNLKKQPSAFDIRHNFVSNFAYEVPFGQNLTGVGGALIKGWQLNGVLSLVTGHPLTVFDNNEAQIDAIGDNESQRANLIPGGDNNPVLGGADRYFDTSQFAPSTLGFFGTAGPGTLRAPGLAQFDFSLLKSVQITEKNRLQFRAEFFNLFNRVNFGNPEADAFTTTGAPNDEAGRIDRTRTSSRQIQFALKYIF